MSGYHGSAGDDGQSESLEIGDRDVSMTGAGAVGEESGGVAEWGAGGEIGEGKGGERGR